jgi:Fe-S oxidoreductase
MQDGQAPISYAPTAGLSYDPSEAVYWEPAALADEITRVFDICHGCRMCFKFCDSFPDLFRRVDEEDGDVRKLGPADTERVMDGCFQCKLCEVQCPYTPRDGHEFQLDFPRLVHRYKAQRHRREGGSLRDAALADPDRAARHARASIGVANAMNRNAVHRWFLEKALGIHRDKLLPEFASTTFERWAEQQGRIVPGERAAEVEAVLFPTCYVQNNEPEVGRDTLEVLDRNGVKTACAKGLACCGMPAWERGDLELVREKAHATLDVLEPFVAAGAKVLAINPTCSMMMRREWPELCEGRDRERASALAALVQDPSEFVWSLRDEERFAGELPGGKREGTFAYHAPCHLRAQAVGFTGRDLIRKVTGLVPTLVMECCGHDGTYAMTVEGFEPSQRIGRRAFDGMREAVDDGGDGDGAERQREGSCGQADYAVGRASQAAGGRFEGHEARDPGDRR